jgi:hypothetical protein
LPSVNELFLVTKGQHMDAKPIRYSSLKQLDVEAKVPMHFLTGGNAGPRAPQ